MRDKADLGISISKWEVRWGRRKSQSTTKTPARSVACQPMAQSEVLREASERGDSAGVEFALRHGADLDAADLGSGMSALHYAAWHGRKNVVDQLITARAAVNTTSHSGLSPLLMAAW